MKKIVRLTERDLTKIVRRVLQEQVQPQPKLGGIEECFQKFQVTLDKGNYPNCHAANLQLISGRTPDAKTMAGCASELTTNLMKEIDPFKLMQFGTCIMQKSKSSPVMY